MTDLIGWVATLIMLMGCIDLIHKNVRGWWLYLIGNLLWAVVGCMSGLTSLIAISTMMALADAYGIVKWRNNG